MSIQEIKTAKITEKGQIAIPADMRELRGFKEGSRVVILSFEDHIEIRPLKQMSDSRLTAIASEKVLRKDWDSKEEDEAWKKL